MIQGQTVLPENKTGKTDLSEGSRPDGLACFKPGKTVFSDDSRPDRLVLSFQVRRSCLEIKLARPTFLNNPGQTVLPENKPSKTDFSDNSRPESVKSAKQARQTLLIISGQTVLPGLKTGPDRLAWIILLSVTYIQRYINVSVCCNRNRRSIKNYFFIDLKFVLH